ncbi:MAG: hypothetical protein FJ297_16480 [Planctomycetes bacterium]|nr:hypothetical protein [Planctomycetota bacterium]
MTLPLVSRVTRAVRKPPRVLARRAAQELRKAGERWMARVRTPGATPSSLLRATKCRSVDALWNRIAARPCVTWVPDPRDAADTRAALDQLIPRESSRIIEAARRAIDHRVDLLGSGLVELGPTIDWHRDYRTGHRWDLAYSPDIEYTNPDRPSDVKFPWELSRMQWLIPTAQAYALTADERYAAFARDTIADWILQNPPLRGVNWSCTMEIAVRILSWTWFFHVFHASPSWSCDGFRERFLTSLFTHAIFAERFLEFSDINGNHCTADAAGMACAGLFFGEGEAASRWRDAGWRLLSDELPRQVTPDGVDFEASTAYHRLVLELFLLPALYRERLGYPVDDAYRNRVTAMARYVRAYARDDGTIPLLGDADDARALPLGDQPRNDHRYLLALVGTAWRVSDLIDAFSGSRAEAFWWFGPERGRAIPDRPRRPLRNSCEAFPDGGVFILANDRDHVVIDCGPVGLAGRGGHGHNDCLSFECVLDGTHLVTDCGSYVYTASFADRQRFRGTASHNTPILDGLEINRFTGPRDLWTLHDDAKPDVRRWEPGGGVSRFEGSHAGYAGRIDSWRPVRRIELDHAAHRLTIDDRFESSRKEVAPHHVEIPLHLAPGTSAEPDGNARWLLRGGDRIFRLEWTGDGNWRVERRAARCSPSYGVAVPIVRLTWICHSMLDNVWLRVAIEPDAGSRAEPARGADR